MADPPSREEVIRRTVVYRMPGMEGVRIRRDVEWRVTDSGPLVLDLYLPRESAPAARIPAVIFVSGYPDPGFQTMLGCRFKDVGQYVSWGQLVAASGLAAITYSNREPKDVHALVQHVRENAAALGIDGNRLGIFGCSGNGPTALSVLMSGASPAVKCAVLCYALTLDSGASTVVADAAKAFGFANACEGKSIDDLPPSLPLFVARAGRDELPRLNESLDRFVAQALTRNLPLTLVNHAEGPHSFDSVDDSETSREIVRHILAFLGRHLSV
jgi:dienelactone hydrolase